jgi:hypothetical protein
MTFRQIRRMIDGGMMGDYEGNNKGAMMGRQ